MKPYKYRFLRLIAAALALLFTLMPAYATKTDTAETTSYNWYCCRTKNGEAPRLAPEFSLIREHQCVFYNDRTADGDRVIYLTFDAGYINENVISILDTLEAHQAQGAFFILDHVIEASPDVVRRMAESGHLVCNHTMRHHDMSKVTDCDAFAKELAGLAERYRNCTGQEMPMFYRPPEGKFSPLNLSFADSLGYTTVFWSFAYADWDNDRQPDCDAALQKILKGTHNGEILLLHPTSATNAAILDRLLTAWEEQGYRFGSLNELVRK